MQSVNEIWSVHIILQKKKTTLCQKIVQKLHLFVFVKNLAQAVLGNEIFEASYLFA